MKDQDTEKFKTLMKEIENTNKWKRIPCSGTRRTNSPYYSNNSRFSAILVNISMAFFTEIESTFLKSISTHKRS